MVLFLHNRYRTTGGEERVVDDLLALVREHLGEPAELLERDSAALGKLSAATGLLRGGMAPREVAKAVRLTGARVVHAHNLNPLFGWRALAAAREEGARVVVHLHQYRLVCATGVCFTGGQECTRCHGRNTLPGVMRNCRGGRAEALAYGASLALWQQRLVEQADAFIVPSEFARERLRELGAPLDWERVHVLPPPVELPEEVAETKSGSYALVVSRLAPEKGVDVAIEACQMAGVPLVVAGDGPRAAETASAEALPTRWASRFALCRTRGRRGAGPSAQGRCTGDRPLSFGRDVRDGGSRGDGGRRAGGREPRRSVAGARRAGGSRRSWRRHSARRGDRAPLAGHGRGRARASARAGAMCAVRCGRGSGGRIRDGWSRSSSVGTRLRRGGGIVGNRSRA